MAELICPTCGTSYDTGGFEPGQRFRCRGDGCAEKLTVPELGDETPTPAPIDPTPAHEAPVKAAAVVDDDEDVLEPREGAGGGRKRGGTGRRRRGPAPRAAAPAAPAGPVDRHGRPLPQAASPAPLYAAIGGVLLIVLIVIFAVMGGSTGGPPKSKAKNPKRNKKWAKVKDDYVPKTYDPAKDPAKKTDGDDAAGNGTEEKPTPVKRTKKDFRFVEKSGLKSKLEGEFGALLHEDPNTAEEAADRVFGMGTDVVPVILNYLADVKFSKQNERALGYHLLEIVKDHLGDEARDKVGDKGEVNPHDSGMWAFKDAVKLWREYVKGTGVATKEVEVERG